MKLGSYDVIIGGHNQRDHQHKFQHVQLTCPLQSWQNNPLDQDKLYIKTAVSTFQESSCLTQQESIQSQH